MITPTAASRPSVPPPVGDGKRSKARRGGSGHKSACAFKAMASLCEEEEELALAATASAVAAMPARIDVFAALCNKEGQWGDLAVFGDLVAAPARRGYVQRADGTWRDLAVQSTMEDLFAQPFATRLGTEDYDDEVMFYLNTEDLTQEEFEAMMRWLYFEGWHVPGGEELWCAGQTVEIWPFVPQQKPRSWVPYTEPEEVVTGPSAFQLAVEAAATRGPSRFMLAAGACDAPAAPAAQKPKAETASKPRVVIPRFCKHAEACPNKDTTCNYTHGDTIPCVDKPCGFDKPAEGKCCSGDKRKTCIFMHASEGQTYSPEQVVHRLPSA
jgi:hypothetical protein